MRRCCSAATGSRRSPALDPQCACRQPRFEPLGTELAGEDVMTVFRARRLAETAARNNASEERLQVAAVPVEDDRDRNAALGRARAEAHAGRDDAPLSRCQSSCSSALVTVHPPAPQRWKAPQLTAVGVGVVDRHLGLDRQRLRRRATGAAAATNRCFFMRTTSTSRGRSRGRQIDEIRPAHSPSYPFEFRCFLFKNTRARRSCRNRPGETGSGNGLVKRLAQARARS